MHYIYTDEAGQTAAEPVTIVAAVLVDADRQYTSVEKALDRVLSNVPEHFKDDFHFHAKSIWGDERWRHGWTFDARLAFLKAMMAIPSSLGLTVTVGVVRRGVVPLLDDLKSLLKVREDQWDHMIAFMECISIADMVIQKTCAAEEVASVVAEDVEGIREQLKMTLIVLRRGAYNSIGIPYRQSSRQAALGIHPPPRIVNAERIRDTIHFVKKREAPMLQIADACAFGMRRFLSNQSFGQDFANAIAGRELDPADWQGGIVTSVLTAPH